MFYGKLPGQRAAGALLDVGLDERLLNFELFFGEFEYAILVDLVPDLTEKIGDIARGRCRVCGGWLGLLRQAMARKQQSKGHHRSRERLSEPVVIHLPLIPEASSEESKLTVRQSHHAPVSTAAAVAAPSKTRYAGRGYGTACCSLCENCDTRAVLYRAPRHPARQVGPHDANRILRKNWASLGMR